MLDYDSKRIALISEQLSPGRGQAGVGHLGEHVAPCRNGGEEDRKTFPNEVTQQLIQMKAATTAPSCRGPRSGGGAAWR